MAVWCGMNSVVLRIGECGISSVGGEVCGSGMHCVGGQMIRCGTSGEGGEVNGTGMSSVFVEVCVE